MTEEIAVQDEAAALIENPHSKKTSNSKKNTIDQAEY